MRRKFDAFASQGKRQALAMLQMKLNSMAEFNKPVILEAVKRKVNTFLQSTDGYALESVVQETGLQNEVYEAYQACQNHCTEDEFISALEEYLLDHYLQTITRDLDGRYDLDFINPIIKKLQSTSWSVPWEEEFSMAEKIHCAWQLRRYMQDPDNQAGTKTNTPIKDQVIDKYAILRKRFAYEIQSFNDAMRRAKAGQGNASQINLDLAQPRATTAYLRARIGGITKFSESKKYQSAGDKEREKKRREDVTYYATLNTRADNVRSVIAHANVSAVDYGIADVQQNDIGFEVFQGGSLTQTMSSLQQNRFILHVDSGQKKLFYVYYIYQTPIQIPITLADDVFDKLLKDLAYIVTGNADRHPTPTLRVKHLSTQYSSNFNGTQARIHPCPDLINFIIDATGFVPDEALQNQYAEMAEIKQQAVALRQEISVSQLISKQKYLDAIDTLEKISTLPYAYFRTSESVIPRYKCKELLTKLERKFDIASENQHAAQELDPKAIAQRRIDQEYFRSSYKLYEVRYMLSDNDIRNSLNKNPRFYYCHDTKDIAYVDAFGVIHKSKLKPRVNTGSDFDYYANAALDTSPEKLHNLLARKKSSNGVYTLDSEEVFKYISLKVEEQDKDKFKMCTVNEELEMILADEAATTNDALRNLCMTALYAALIIMLVLVPGFNLAFFAALSVGIGYFPNFFDSVSSGAYKDALRNAGMAVLMIAIMASVAFIPGLNILGVGAAAGAMMYVTLAIASLTTAFYLSATISAASKNPKVKEANKQLSLLKNQIKEFTLQDDDDEEEAAAYHQDI